MPLERRCQGLQVHLMGMMESVQASQRGGLAKPIQLVLRLPKAVTCALRHTLQPIRSSCPAGQQPQEFFTKPRGPLHSSTDLPTYRKERSLFLLSDVVLDRSTGRQNGRLRRLPPQDVG